MKPRPALAPPPPKPRRSVLRSVLYWSLCTACVIGVGRMFDVRPGEALGTSLAAISLLAAAWYAIQELFRAA